MNEEKKGKGNNQTDKNIKGKKYLKQNKETHNNIKHT